MKKTILLIAVIAATSLTMGAFTTQSNYNATVNNEVADDEYLQIAFKNLSTDFQNRLLKEFEGYEIRTIYQNLRTKLYKVIVIVDNKEKTFIENEEGAFIEQE
ncbi:MAG: hypothetical protein FWC10_05350 [Lentimicrobiaceae bacterium]|nr:hypothetical protein [Lentimicrobiaceae bacterium]